jgi:hypothetical protein
MEEEITAFSLCSSRVNELNLFNDLVHEFMFAPYVDDLLSSCHGIQWSAPLVPPKLCRLLDTNAMITSTLSRALQSVHRSYYYSAAMNREIFSPFAFRAADPRIPPDD